MVPLIYGCITTYAPSRTLTYHDEDFVYNSGAPEDGRLVVNGTVVDHVDSVQYDSESGNLIITTTQSGEFMLLEFLTVVDALVSMIFLFIVIGNFIKARYEKLKDSKKTI